MLVHIAVKAGRGADHCREVGACVHRAADAALSSACDGLVRVVTEEALEVALTPGTDERNESDEDAVVVLMYPRSKYSGRKKRSLFGRIGEALEKELQISRRNLVIGIIETPGRNWTFGYDRAELALAMEGQLP
jgi:hypothetical protein